MVDEIIYNSGLSSFPQARDLPLEIWSVIAEYIHGRNTLRSLARVSRTFRNIFHPKATASFNVELGSSRWKALEEADTLLANLKYTQHLEINLSNESLNAEDDESDLEDEYSSAVLEVLMSMPNLQSFRWFDSSYYEEFGIPLLLDDWDLLHHLKECSTLKHLSVQLASVCPDFETLDFDRLYFNFTGFKNLTSLELYHIWNDYGPLCEDLASTLAECPTLELLGLGVACEIDCGESSEVLTIVDNLGLTERLCEAYRSKSAPPLALKTLRLGHGLFVHPPGVPGPPPADPAVDNYLARLVNLATLEVIHLWNGYWRYIEADPEDEAINMRLDWNVLRDCQSLRQVEVSLLEANLIEWLNQEKRSSVTELVVTDHSSMYDEQLDCLENLKLAGLKMICMSEVKMPEVPLEDPSYHFLVTRNKFEDESALVPRSTITVLDRLNDGGADVERLSITLDFEKQWNRFQRTLANLTKLTYLRLSSKSWNSEQYPPRASSLRQGITRAKLIAMDYAKVLKEICPSLQAIRIQNWTWSYYLSGDGETDLRQLEYEDMMQIDIFSTDKFTVASGLTGPDPYRVEDTPQQEENWEQIRDLMKENIRLGNEVEDRMMAGELTQEEYEAAVEEIINQSQPRIAELRGEIKRGS